MCICGEGGGGWRPKKSCMDPRHRLFMLQQCGQVGGGGGGEALPPPPNFTHCLHNELHCGIVILYTLYPHLCQLTREGNHMNILAF